PGIAPVLEAVRKLRPKKVFLTPLLVVAGDHATNDMAGDEEDSWKNQLLREGVEVECVVKGLGEYEKVRELYIEHAKEADK
ncbi:MAG: sirohydrochlorin cobaltochelatase, partial [Eubacteriales bacterium]|nr:sirohydrochlorin cobaltochelatase [Eubacteriales bacterium]